jgi:prolyl 4-hydroxylase
MSNVEWGGATVFPFFDGHIAPKKGSASFWYNLHASGEGRILASFAAFD